MIDDRASDGERDGDPARRKCIVTGERQPKAGLIRFVVGPDGCPVADLEERLPGRGLWLSAQRDVVNTACAKNLFARAARRRVEIPEGFADGIEGLLLRRCMELIGLSRRSGAVVGGFVKVRTRLEDGRAALLLLASDAGAEGRRKMGHLAAALPVRSVLSGDELGRAMGRERIVHVAVGPGRLANRLLRDLDRLAGFRPCPVDDERAV